MPILLIISHNKNDEFYHGRKTRFCQGADTQETREGFLTILAQHGLDLTCYNKSNGRQSTATYKQPSF